MAPADNDATGACPRWPSRTLQDRAPMPADATHLAEQNLLWQRVSHRLKTELGEAKWRAWIKPLLVQEFTEDNLTLRASTAFLRDRVLSNYLDKIACWQLLKQGLAQRCAFFDQRSGSAFFCRSLWPASQRRECRNQRSCRGCQ